MFFLGLIIGNFVFEVVDELLVLMSDVCWVGDFVLIGVDFRKDEYFFEVVYNDVSGVIYSLC